jgi:hypothetical protein
MELGQHTDFEILSQPDAWAKMLESVETRAADLRDFFRVRVCSHYLQPPSTLEVVRKTSGAVAQRSRCWISWTSQHYFTGGRSQEVRKKETMSNEQLFNHSTV